MAGLGTTSVVADVFLRQPPHLYPSSSLFRRLLLLSPAARLNEIRVWRETQLTKLMREQRLVAQKVLRIRRDPVGVSVAVTAAALSRLSKSKHVGSITIQSVHGKRPRATAAAHRLRGQRLYSVRALFALQWEKQDQGLQLVEDRVVLMQARSEAEAKRRAERQFRYESSPALDPRWGRFRRWGYQGIVDVCESTDEKWSPSGTEAYYEIRNRRMKRQYEWHPQRRREKSV